MDNAEDRPPHYGKIETRSLSYSVHVPLRHVLHARLGSALGFRRGHRLG